MTISAQNFIALTLAGLNLIAFIISMSSRGSWIVTLVSLTTTVTLAAYAYPKISPVVADDNYSPEE